MAASAKRHASIVRLLIRSTQGGPLRSLDLLALSRSTPPRLLAAQRLPKLGLLLLPTLLCIFTVPPSRSYYPTYPANSVPTTDYPQIMSSAQVARASPNATARICWEGHCRPPHRRIDEAANHWTFSISRPTMPVSIGVCRAFFSRIELCLKS